MSALEAIFIAVLDASWKASCLVPLLLGLQRWLRGRVAARVLFWLWLAVALRLLLPISLPTTWSPFAFADWARGPAVVPAPKQPPEAARVAALPATSHSLPMTAAALSPFARLSWTQWAALVWCGGAVVLLTARALARQVFMRKIGRSAVPIAAGRLPPDLVGLLQQRRVRVVVSDAVSAPALHGIFQPRVLFPPGFLEKLSPSEIRLTIAHELAHAERRDLLADAVLHVAVVVHWFNPLAWVAARAARVDCELACDEHVMRRVSEDEREHYGATLLKILRLTAAAPPPRFGLGVVAAKHQIKRRIQMILTHPALSLPRTLLCLAVFALITGLSFTSEATGQAAPPTTIPAPTDLGAHTPTDAPSIVYNPDIDRLDHLFPTGVVATVNDRDITVADVRRYIAPLIPALQREARTQEEFNARLGLRQNNAIKDLVNRAVLIRQFHDRRDGEQPKTIPPEYVDNAIADELKERFNGDRQKFLEFLRSQNLTQRDYRRQTEENIIYQYMRGQERKLASQTEPPKATPADKPIRLRTLQLTRSAGETDATLLEKANMILARFRNGESFEQLARESDQSVRKSRGGDWGWIGPSDVQARFRDAFMALQKGDVSAPILLPEGCYLLYAEDRR